MKHEASGAWLKLNVSYYIAPVCNPLDLLDDASLLLSGAQGMARTLNDLMSQSDDADYGDLANAIWGVATLIELGQRSAQEAHKRMYAMREKADWMKECDVVE